MSLAKWKVVFLLFLIGGGFLLICVQFGAFDRSEPVGQTSLPNEANRIALCMLGVHNSVADADNKRFRCATAKQTETLLTAYWWVKSSGDYCPGGASDLVAKADVLESFDRRYFDRAQNIIAKAREEIDRYGVEAYMVAPAKVAEPFCKAVEDRYGPMGTELAGLYDRSGCKDHPGNKDCFELAKQGEKEMEGD